MRMRERCACGAEFEVEDVLHVCFEQVREWRIRHARACTIRQQFPVYPPPSVVPEALHQRLSDESQLSNSE